MVIQRRNESPRLWSVIELKRIKRHSTCRIWAINTHTEILKLQGSYFRELERNREQSLAFHFLINRQSYVLLEMTAAQGQPPQQSLKKNLIPIPISHFFQQHYDVIITEKVILPHLLPPHTCLAWSFAHRLALGPLLSAPSLLFNHICRGRLTILDPSLLDPSLLDPSPLSFYQTP